VSTNNLSTKVYVYVLTHADGDLRHAAFGLPPHFYSHGDAARHQRLGVRVEKRAVERASLAGVPADVELEPAEEPQP
jgi:hypothetical protein